MTVNKIGIMQGRLVPPLNGELQAFPLGHWAEEFTAASEAGLDCIEWIFDYETVEENPIWQEGGAAILNSLTEQNNVGLWSVCADYFMRKPLLDVAEFDKLSRLNTLDHLIECCARIGINRVIIPFVDASSIRTERDRTACVELLKEGAASANKQDIELHLETDLGPQAFVALLSHVAAPNVKVNYDSGNSAALGFDPVEELAAYGNLLGSVHIKDRVLNGCSVPLGLGAADFQGLFTALRKLDYQGDYILQTARGDDGKEVKLAQQNRAMVERWIAG